MTSRVEHSLVGEDATGRREIFEDFTFHCAARTRRSGGLLFGWPLAFPATVIAATAGASVVFLIAKTSFGELSSARHALA